MKIKTLAENLSQLSLFHAIIFIALFFGYLYFKGQTTVKLAKIFVNGLVDTMHYIVKLLGFLATLVIAFLTNIISSSQFFIVVLGCVMAMIIYYVAEEAIEEENDRKNPHQQPE